MAGSTPALRLCLGLCLVAAALAGCRSEASRPPKARDVVLVVVDALRADHLSLQGYDRPTSPALERLGKDAVVFTRASAPATWCVPAQASLLTGRWPSYHGAERVGPGDPGRAQPLDADATTLAEILAGAGFATAAFVGNGAEVSPAYGFARGFAEFEAGAELARGSDLAGRVAQWLAAHPEPAFVLASIADPSEPYEPPAELARRFAVGGDEAFGSSPRELLAATGRLTPEAIAHFTARYDGEVAAADQAIGEIVDALRGLGRYEDALVVVTGDHGELLGEHGLFGHGRPPFEPEVHVPLIVKYPGARRGGERVERRVSTIGVFATILDTARAASPRRVQARPLDDLQPVWLEDIDPRGQRFRVGYDGPDWKVIGTSGPRGEVSCLFDLLADPGELRPNCDGASPSPLRLALASFTRRERPAHSRPELVAAGEAGTGAAGTRAAN